MLTLLKQWRNSRGIKINGSIVASLQEEVNELKEALINNDEHEVIDALADICVFAINDVEARGYSFDKVMLEVIKEISSRTQNPEQYDRWKDNPKLQDVEKWEKDKTQTANTLYKADFSTCKIHR